MKPMREHIRGRGEIVVDGRVIAFTPLEHKILCILIDADRDYVSSLHLASRSDLNFCRLARWHITRIRKKLEGVALIENRQQWGYALTWIEGEVNDG